jgi:hypothetical protein
LVFSEANPGRRHSCRLGGILGSRVSNNSIGDVQQKVEDDHGRRWSVHRRQQMNVVMMVETRHSSDHVATKKVQPKHHLIGYCTNSIYYHNYCILVFMNELTLCTELENQ